MWVFVKKEKGGGGRKMKGEGGRRRTRDVAVMFGADEDIAQRDVRDIVELEIKLANVSVC